MAANRVWKEYKELTKEVSKNGPDKEISLAPVDDSNIFAWTVRTSPLHARAPALMPRPSCLAHPSCACCRARRRSAGRPARPSRVGASR